MIILAIGLLDLITTMNWVSNHGAQEANPVFRFYLAMGPLFFVGMKLICIIAPLFLLEWAARRRPVFTRWAARGAIVAYLSMYCVGVMRLNPHLFSKPSEAERLSERMMIPEQPIMTADEFKAIRVMAQLQEQGVIRNQSTPNTNN